MKTKYITLAMTVLIAGMMFTACGKEDNDESNDNGGNEQPTNVPDQTGFNENGASEALFSVSETKQVRFSCGNLQYKASTNTWRFAEQQYDYIGESNSNVSSTYDGWTDLFCWGTSGWESGYDAYQPWDTVSNENAYLPYEIRNDYAEADWAWHNAIQNGGNQSHLWRVLTLEECQYLFNNRSNANEKRGFATVGEVHGLVVLPDNWELPDSLSFNADISDWSVNQYTLLEWKLMQKAGAIFLPAAGTRIGAEVRAVEMYGIYWASNCNNYSPYLICFNEQSAIEIGGTSPRSVARSVRPVMDYNTSDNQ